MSYIHRDLEPQLRDAERRTGIEASPATRLQITAERLFNDLRQAAPTAAEEINAIGLRLSVVIAKLARREREQR